jgi:glucosamine-6-phosphate deaminase
MNLQVCNSEQDWVRAINEWLAAELAQRRMNRIFLPAGETPKPLYRDWQNKPPDFLENLKFVQLDEILTGTHRFAFRQFFRQYMPDYNAQFEFIDHAEEGADLALLGLGYNGHVAFHEPGIDPSFYSGCLTLNTDTAKRLCCEPNTRVVSYGLGAFLRTRAALMIVRDESKRSILRRVLDGDTRLPASHLLKHENFHIITNFALDEGPPA